ncbi:acyl-CoA dehydrogenase family protein [Neoroseomonas oryzicola]|uniref:Acyl-CoA dehydrogenase n=1 Tax=Neoroseomonas oryzicola TaxID=535904 RepID=A0A9X9WN82_9PROT|nr:acyl-CoA dehydrogenase family protein [Neoroseomonas oryzicola]MBR0661792.1 acyl-CoA dehydrogenase [Neoroseomonas oryzicola]NKE17100.1 acyl-CoA dehydrogenase [Neoroseomonas oryzicola]
MTNVFDLPEATRELQSVARDFAREVLAPNALRWDEQRHFPVEEMREAAKLGMAALYVREESGGSGLTRLDAAVVFEALATGCPVVSAYLSIHNMVAWMIDRFGNDAQRAEWLPGLASMERVASYALTEPGSGSDAAALRTRAARDNEGYVLNGTKQFISGAGASDLYLTMVRTGGEGPSGVSALLIPKEAEGLSFGANERKMGWNAQPTRQVIFENARVPATALLGEEGHGFRFAMAGLDGGRLNIAACSLGGAQSALDIALDYVKERKAFGKALADFQNTQFRLADMRIELEAARSLLWRAAAKLDAKEPDATAWCAMAKRFVTDTCSRIADEALQLLGGYGYLADYGIEKIVRDLRVHRILEGTNEIMRLIVARQMLGAR